MIKITAIFISTIYLVALFSCGHKTEKINNEVYTIDSDIKSAVEQKVMSYRGATMTSMDMKIIKNDTVIFNSYEKDKIISPCLIYSELEGGSISINVFAEPFSGPGYDIKILNDTCIVRHVVQLNSAEPIYKLKKTDPLTSSLSIAPETYKLTLVTKPTFKKGDIVEGIIELTAPEYYVVMDEQEIKYKIKLTGYFRTDSLAGKEEKGKSIFPELDHQK